MSIENKPMLRADYRPLDFQIVDTYLDFNFDSKAEFPSTVRSKLTFKRLTPGATSFVLDGQDLQLLKLRVNGLAWDDYKLENLPGEGKFQNLTLDISKLDDQDNFVVEIENTLEVENNKLLSGIYKAGEHICSQCESKGFRLITYYFDRPDNLSVFTVKITADKAKYPYLLSNGNPVESGDLAEGKHFAVWHDPFPKPSYLFALVAGEFDVLEDQFVTKSGRKVDLKIFAEVGKGHQLHFAMSSLKRSMKWDEDRFDLEYDLDLFMIVAVSFFNMGAMENKGLNIFNESALVGDKDTATDARLKRIDKVVGHEYFHNWTGDRVTCRDWFQLTLKEGLTVFRDQEFTSDTFDRTIERIESVAIMQNHQFDEDRGPTSHPIRPEKVLSQDNFYTLTVYDKGSEVIRMIHTLIGEQNFQKGMKLYFERHDGKAVTCDDFVAAMADASGVNLDRFKLWYSQSGTPHVTVKQHFDAEHQVLFLDLEQVTYPTHNQKEKHPLVLPLKTIFLDREGNQVLDLKTVDGKPVESLIVLEEAKLNLQIATDKPLVVVTNVDFSAPVIVHQDRSFEELAFVAQHIPNEYSRYQAIQDLNFEVYKAHLTNNPVLAGQALGLYLNVFETLLGKALDNPALYATLLRFTTPDAVAARFEKDLDPLAVAKVYKHVNETLTRAHGHRALALYQDLPEVGAFEFNVQQAGLRDLKYVLLRLITGEGEHKELVRDLYTNADNFTDRINALNLNLTNNLGLAELEKEFLERYHHEVLVLDAYQSLRATLAKDINEVKDLTKLHTYDAHNPNRVRAILNPLAFYNYNVMYNLDGTGVQYIAQEALRTDKFNPQLSSNLVNLLLKFFKLAPQYQKLVLEQLEFLASQTLSNNAREKVESALEMAKDLK
ncbi:aminopeptidase N [Psittacicella melopsittaci]|uniref:Aminopeptidase N n=1 Tax=Psittacicella melopsittaci TaxID=2028576 RepID=A0A3A1Y4V8_9GAMM|nr:aminopeptidase N [Psittacicella melopsittaci]RIY32420.1 aminopeptidase N [Psittacicella melopsittaci]